MKPKGIIPGITALCAILGMLIGVQYNTVQSQAASAAGTDNVRLTELSAELRKEREEKEALEKQLDKQAELLETYEAGDSDGAALESLQKENEKLRAFAGLSEQTGAGIVVTMDDSDKDMGGDKNAYLVHAEDILKVVNELFVAGAEAVSVNGQRIVAQSGITCAGSVITVNGVRVAAPFEIKAIGDASVLQAALRFPGGVVDTLSPWGIVIDIREEASVTVPAYTVLGGVRADMEHQFQMRIFVSGFFINGIVAIGLVWLGKQLNMDLSIAAIVVFGSRIFYNFSKIRRFLLNKRQKEAMIGEE